MNLNECPHCGSPAALDDCRTIWRVICTSAACGALVLGDRAPEPDGEMGEAYWNGIKQTAIDRWNARAIAPPVAAGNFRKIADMVPEYASPEDFGIPADYSKKAQDYADWFGAKRAEKAEAQARKLSLDLLAAQGETDAALDRVKQLEAEREAS